MLKKKDKIQMELPLFNFLFHLTDEKWRTQFQLKFELLYKPLLDESFFSIDEYQNMSYLIESWISTMMYHTIYNEKETAPYEEFQVTYKLPRFTIKANVTIYR